VTAARPLFLWLGILALGGVSLMSVIPAGAADDSADISQSRQSLADARAQADAARQRGEKLEGDAAAASAAADRTAQQAAAVAARIQQAEAEIGLARARIAMIERDRQDLRDRIAQRQEPLVRLTAALQLMARRPLAFSLMRADSLRETVWLRATLETALPQVAARTASLRAEIDRSRRLQEQARAEADTLTRATHDLAARRNQLVTLESRQRIASRAAEGNAARETDRVLALSEQTRDLSALVQQLSNEDGLAARLAALPGPIARPDNLNASRLMLAAPVQSGPPLVRFSGVLPVTGRLVSGFGEATPTGSQRGIRIAPAPGAQAVAPAPGRVAFAGPYRGFGHIVIITHDGGWSSLITGLARLDVQVGDQVVQGAPIGTAEPGGGEVAVELRHDGTPVNPRAVLKR